MPPVKKKRFNAFEDFPATETNKTPLQPLQQIKDTADTSLVERIERLSPSEMMPDRFQPRRLLPAHIRNTFFNREIDCYQAASEWLKFAQHDSGVKAEIERLLNLGSSFDSHGQIKPITGSWVNDEKGNFYFLIETGERRFWAACLQRVTTHTSEEPSLRVEVIENPTRQRQVLENRHAESPSAVEQACEVAALILAEQNKLPDQKTSDDYEYFRIARDQRMPAGLWDKIIPIMQLTRPRMVQLLNILQLPSHLLELADRFRLPERVIREILNQPAAEWEGLIRQSIQNSLTSDDIVDQIIEKEEISTENKAAPSKTPSTPEKMALRSMRRFTRVFRRINRLEQSEILDHMADELYGNKQAKDTLEILDELASLLRARLSRQ
ncbi:MAG: hypothetical protein ACYDH1_02280 [Anaerolineaceae bacterium]